MSWSLNKAKDLLLSKLRRCFFTAKKMTTSNDICFSLLWSERYAEIIIYFCVLRLIYNRRPKTNFGIKWVIEGQISFLHCPERNVLLIPQTCLLQLLHSQAEIRIFHLRLLNAIFCLHLVSYVLYKAGVTDLVRSWPRTYLRVFIRCFRVIENLK